MSADHARAQVIQRARDLAADFDAMTDGPGRYECCADATLAAALETLCGHGLQDDYGWDASTDASWDRIDRWLLSTSEAGFVIVEEFADAADAKAGLERLSAADCEVAV